MWRCSILRVSQYLRRNPSSGVSDGKALTPTTSSWKAVSGILHWAETSTVGGIESGSRSRLTSQWCELWDFFHAVEKPGELEDEPSIHVSEEGHVGKIKPEALSQENAQTQATPL